MRKKPGAAFAVPGSFCLQAEYPLGILTTDLPIGFFAELPCCQLFIQPGAQREHHVGIYHIRGEEQPVGIPLQEGQAEGLVPHDGPAAAVGAEVTIEVWVLLKEFRHPAAGDDGAVAPAVAAFLTAAYAAERNHLDRRN